MKINIFSSFFINFRPPRLAGWNKINEESRGNILWSAGVVHTTPDETSIKKYILILAVLLFLGFCSQIKFAVAQTINVAPVGSFDVADCNTFAGWTCDADDYSKPLYVHFYIDGPAGSGTYLFNTVAGNPREIAPACGGNGNHSFYVSPPASIRDGKSHTIYAYAINVPDGVNPLLGSKTIQCQAPVRASGENGDAQISTVVDGSPLDLKTCDWTAGAVCSITWKGTEFINTYDHGRELQSASSFDGTGECYNPTEGGSKDDGSSPNPSTSVLKAISASGNILTTKTQMAFWLNGTETGLCGLATSAVNTNPLSNHILNKKITLGFQGMPHVMEYLADFTVGENHSSGSFEAAVGFMPSNFTSFYTYDPTTKQLASLPISEGGSKRQDKPLIFTTSDGSYAMGIYSPALPQYGVASYGAVNGTLLGSTAFAGWDCHFEVAGPIVAGQTLSFGCYPIVGSLKEVTDSMDLLANYFAPHINYPPEAYFDAADCSSFSGWACDQDDYSKSLAVNFYGDGPAGQGTFVGSSIANNRREQGVTDLCDGNASHGFSFVTPANLKDGKSHKIYAYAINIPAGENLLLANSPKTITCAKSLVCIPNCLGNNCGSNGCGGTCGTCVSNQICINGICRTNSSRGGDGGGEITISPVTPPVIGQAVKPATQMTRDQILAKIGEIKKLLIQLIQQLIVELQKQSLPMKD